MLSNRGCPVERFFWQSIIDQMWLNYGDSFVMSCLMYKTYGFEISFHDISWFGQLLSTECINIIFHMFVLHIDTIISCS